jgi:CubicO group peptidase (beta-lactamase class C family)
MLTNATSRATRCIALLGMLGSMLAGCSSSPASLPPASVATQAAVLASDWPTEAWRTSPPEAQGIDASKLAQMLAYVQQQHLDLHSLLVIRNGYIVSETYFGSYTADTRHPLYSCTKSFIATLIGIALDQGVIDQTDHRVVDFFPGQAFAHLDAHKQSMTLEDLLTMRSGLSWQEGDPVYRAMYQSPDWVKFVMDEEMAGAPGSAFNYCSGCSHVLSAILQKTTGMNTAAYAEHNLFQPLGIANVAWETDPAEIPIGGWGLQMTPREMAKLGYLYLHDGQWAGQQIVSANWVKAATQQHTPTDSQLGYGYQWWTYPTLEAYTALGRYGQTIFVIPKLALVIVTTAQLDNHDEVFKLIENYLVPAVQPSH